MKNNKFKSTISIMLAILALIGLIISIFIPNNLLKAPLNLTCVGIIGLLNGFKILSAKKKLGITLASFSILELGSAFYLIVFKLI